MTNEDLLYHYFSKSLTPQQQDEFNKRLETDAAFKAELEYEKNLKKAIINNNAKTVKAKLKTFEAERTKTETVTTPSKFNWRIAASILLFIGATWFGYHSFFNVDYNTLYASNFETYPNTDFSITRSDTIDSFERKAFVAYEGEDYKSAIANFNAIPSSEQQLYHDFYKAQAYLKTDDNKKAKTLFNKMIAENTLYVAESHWYLALLALKEENKKEAIAQLKTLVAHFNYKKSNAEALLKELD